RHTAVNERFNVGRGVAVQAAHQKDVVIFMRECPCSRDGTVTQVVRVTNPPGGRRRLRGQFTVEQREFRVDAGGRAFGTRSPRNSKRNPFSEDYVQNSILSETAGEPCRDWRFNLAFVVGSLDAVSDAGPKPQDLMIWDATLLRIVFPDFDRCRAGI